MKHNYTSIVLLVLSAATSLTCESKDYPDVALSGSLKLDYSYFESQFLEDAEQGEDEFSLRRARFNLKADLSKNWSAKFKVDVHDGLEVKDAYIKYDALDWANLTIGKQKEPFGLEKLMSTKALPFLERSMVSSAISPGRNYGIKFSGSERDVTWQLGYFQVDKEKTESAVTGRFTWGLANANKDFVHIGAAFSERQFFVDSADDDSADDFNFRINENLEVYSADSLIEGIKINADSTSKKGFEFAVQYNGLVGMAEWQESTVSATNGSEYQYDGGYVQASYLFSGKNRAYKNGILNNVKTKNDWEVSLRYSQLTLQQENNKASAVSLGVNYLVTSDIKFMANIINAEYTKGGTDLGSGNAITLRAEYRF
jgi:phosphate-selective porin OprO/OprP